MRTNGSSLLSGWRIVGITALLLAIINVWVWFSYDDVVASVRGVIRSTARSSLILFLGAFTAAALWRFVPNAFTKWLRRERRYIGVSFAVSHTYHLGVIFALGAIAPAELGALANAITWIFGGLAYVFIFAMTATSFDRTAQWIGPKAWRILHTVGIYYVWLIFANSYIGRAIQMPAYATPAILLVAALGLRVAASISNRAGDQLRKSAA